MSRWNLRKRQRNISYYEPDEPPLDEYVYCDHCADIVFEYCAIHGPLLVVPDDKVPVNIDLPSFVPRAALTIPHFFLHLAPSVVPGAGLGVFSSLTLPSGVRFGPYCGKKVDVAHSDYCWQIYNKDHKPSHLVEAEDANRSNWMRYVNCARHWCEQNLVAYQYQGQIYYRTVKIIPKFTELLVFYGSEFANYLHIDIRLFNSPLGQEKLYNVFIKNPMPKTTELPAAKPVQESIKLQCHKSTEAETSSKPNTTAKDIDENSNIIVKIKPNIGVEKIKTVKLKHNSKIGIEKRFKCDICNYTTNIKQSLTVHLRKHTGEKPYQCDICQQTFSQLGSLKNHLRTHTGEKPYQCEICQYKCSEIGSLKKHLRTHTGEKPYQCDICQYTFSRLDSLKSHLRTHTGEKPYQCDICKHSFSLLSNLKTHLRTHTGEKPYQCDICQYKCNEIGRLKKHLRTHTGEKPYQCDICQYKCNEIGSLKRHLRTHTGEKPYQCDICQQTFSQLGNLKTHLRKHTGEKPYQCDICQHTFSLLCNLKTHLRKHTGEKPYQCDICQYKCNEIGRLKKHLRTHTGEKPYQCDICQYKCNKKSSLKTHISTHTKRGTVSI